MLRYLKANLERKGANKVFKTTMKRGFRQHKMHKSSILFYSYSKIACRRIDETHESKETRRGKPR